MAHDPRRVFLTFGDARLERSLRRIRREAEAMEAFDEILCYDERDLSPAFRARWADRLVQGTRGYGYWVWKPEILLRTLETMREGELLLYLDVGCRLIPTGKARLEEYFRMALEAPSGIVVTILSKDFPVRDWSKGDLLDYFGVRDRPDIVDAPQMQAGTLFIRKCPRAVALLERWAKVWEEDFALIDDSPSRSPNLPGFREHRHDQSALSILASLDGGVTAFASGECNPQRRLPGGSPDWSSMDPSLPIWQRRDKAFHYPLKWHWIRFLAHIAPSKAMRERLRKQYRAIPPKEVH